MDVAEPPVADSPSSSEKRAERCLAVLPLLLLPGVSSVKSQLGPSPGSAASASRKDSLGLSGKEEGEGAARGRGARGVVEGEGRVSRRAGVGRGAAARPTDRRMEEGEAPWLSGGQGERRTWGAGVEGGARGVAGGC